MNNIKRYNLFILFSTIARNIVEVFSSVLLYKIGYSFREILLFYSILYFTGMITSIGSIYLTKIIKPKYILMLSSIIFSGSFYFMSVMDRTFTNLVIFSIINGIGAYSYHSLRHYYAIKVIDNHNNKEIGNILIFSNIATIFSSLIGAYIQELLSVFILAIIIVIISIIAIIPIVKLKDVEDNNTIKLERISKNKLLFFLLEQAKVINLTLQPLYLYLFINSRDNKKYFKYLNMIFCIFLIMKLNINNKYLVLLIGLFEGLGIKMFEVVSSENIYTINKNTNVKGYVILVEIIFCLVRSILCLIGYFINDIRIILYISILLIFILSFVKRDNI